jgi:hypothetical protein
MELKPIQSTTLMDYESGQNVEVKQFQVEDLILNHEFATPHAGFALRFNNDKKDGTFLEIGACHWKQGNNTYLLEKEFNWKGVAIDIVKHFADDYNINRSSHCIHGDAFSYNWDQYLSENNFPKRIDYLQIDVDKTPDWANLFALLNVPLSRYRFNTITLEHCANMDPRLMKMRDLQREILFSYGYRIVAAGYDEDWWIDSQLGISESEFNSISYQAWAKKFI